MHKGCKTCRYMYNRDMTKENKMKNEMMELELIAQAEQEELACEELAYNCTTLSKEDVVELYIQLARETGKLRQENDYKF